MTSLSAALVATTRRISYLFPRVTAVGGDQLEEIKQRCRESFQRWGHCECPFPVGDIRREVWVDEEIKLAGKPIPFPTPPDEEEEQKPAAKQPINWECENVRI